MLLSTGFSGRIIQLTDALDRFDAVSNQVVALDRILKDGGFDSLITARFAHPDREHMRVSRDLVSISDKDVLIVHYYGYSDGLEAWLADQYCTKVIIYHNITPHTFFDVSNSAHEFCEKGRSQLESILPSFHYYWGDSQYNIDELVTLGAEPAKTAVIPIVVDPFTVDVGSIVRRSGQWVFVGRVAPNKGIVELVNMFADVHRNAPDAAQKLVIVGSYDPTDHYGKMVAAAVERSGLGARIQITGKITDEERNEVLLSSSIYISLSEHEGFGVPLVEACYFDLPTVALDHAAAAETLGGHGISHGIQAAKAQVLLLSEDVVAQQRLLAMQKDNARRFLSGAVGSALAQALGKVLPKKNQFQTVSVVICTYNRCDHLERCLEYLTYQAREDFEVIVVNGPSTDRTNAVLDQYKDRIKLATNPERNLSKSRNIGIDLAAGDIVAFIDDDALPFDDWVDQILAAYNERPLTIAGLGGPAYYAGTFWFQAEDNGIDADCQVKVNISSSEIGKDGWCRYNTGTNATFTRRHLLEVSGFDEQYDYFLDEAELCFRIQKNNFLMAYVPEIYVRHEFAQSHNRDGKFKYNWFTICKNTAYFIAVHSGRSGRDLRDFIDRRMQDERIKPLNDAVLEGKLESAERDRHVDAILKGVEQGLIDARSAPRTRDIADRPGTFLPYEVRRDRCAVGRDIKPLHICIVSREAPPFAGSGGVGTLYYHLASELLLMGHHVSLLVPSGEDYVHRQGRLSVYFTTPLAFQLPEMDSGFGGNVEWSLTALAKLALIQKERPVDVVDGALWDTETLSFALLDPASRPPLVVRLVTPYAVSADHNRWNPSADQLALFMEAERSLIRNADAVIPISHMIEDTLISKYGLERDGRWSVGHCGIAHWPAFDVNEGYGEFPELAMLDQDLLPDSKLVVFVGRLERRKGIDLIYQAARQILEADPKAILVLAGRDPEGWGDRFRQDLDGPLARRFVALGEVSNAIREKLLAHAYCVLFPSRYESFGLVPLEAFVHGTPVIASRSGAIPEVVIDGKSGILFEVDQADGLADATVRLLHDEGLRAEMASHARQRVKVLSARNSALHSIDVYSRLLDRRRP
ncbi:glycosyltransferase [Sphingomonas sp. RB3P16]|uniref:glycosyltransferase n=1 Tax=Parasphingomonas frigoris TaxID=3096163 RepID=UPI002FC98C60